MSRVIAVVLTPEHVGMMGRTPYGERPARLVQNVDGRWLVDTYPDSTFPDPHVRRALVLYRPPVDRLEARLGVVRALAALGVERGPLDGVADAFVYEQELEPGAFWTKPDPTRGVTEWRTGPRWFAVAEGHDERLEEWIPEPPDWLEVTEGSGPSTGAGAAFALAWLLIRGGFGEELVDLDAAEIVGALGGRGG